MLGALRELFISKPPAATVQTYIALVAASRNPFFYTSLGVPDTIDGRFELIVLHLFLLQQRLVLSEGEPSAKPQRQQFSQFLSESFFTDMDRSLREMGVGDTGVSHRIKKMGKAYHGALQAYAAGMKDAKLLRPALARNLYGTVEQGDIAVLNRMAHYVEKMTEHLATIDSKTIMAGRYEWPDVAALRV